MSAKKPKRGSPALDMTAMVDVAFLLLTFFILTTTRFREETKVEVDTPSSVSSLEVPDKELCIISLSGDGKVFIGFSDIKTRQDALRYFVLDMKERGTPVSIPPEGVAYFTNLQEFGVPHGQVAQWLGTQQNLEVFPHEGISAIVTDSTKMTGNELKDWIKWGRQADYKMRFAIKGDVDAKYETLQHVIGALQDWNVNQFSLITTMEDGGLEAGGHSDKK
ncbi:MAG: biopolymer transporter ExbD [Bacteroidia bacterium]|nr:biopolymer transporter ExbD [Bacteroidia bacterium]